MRSGNNRSGMRGSFHIVAVVAAVIAILAFAGEGLLKDIGRRHYNYSMHRRGLSLITPGWINQANLQLILPAKGTISRTSRTASAFEPACPPPQQNRGKLCVSIGAKTIEECLALMEGHEMVELRLDMIHESGRMDWLFNVSVPIIATCRKISKDVDDFSHNRKQKLLDAIQCGANFVDVEVEAPQNYREEIIRAAKMKGCNVIISYHNFTCTPKSAELLSLRDKCFEHGADIAKVAVYAHTPLDVCRVISVMDCNKPVVAIAMGSQGKLSRITGPLLGAPFTFIAPDNANGTAPGQLTRAQILRVYKSLT
eukprot:jgi/Bigna1/143270/aug1.77_g17978